MEQMIQRSFKDVLTYKKKFKIVFNNTDYWVFKERLANCCSKFSNRIENMKNNKMNIIDFQDFNISRTVFNDNKKEEEEGKEEEESFVYNDKDIKEEIFSSFIKCINGEEIKIKEDNSIGLMILCIEFGYERLKKECEEYISQQDSNIRNKLKEIIFKMVNNKRNIKENKIKDKDFNEFEGIIAKYFNIVIEEEYDTIKKFPIEQLYRIIHNSDFSIERFNMKQKHLFIEMVIYHLKKEGKTASILMNGISIKSFSNSDILLIMEEKYINTMMNIGEKDLKQIIKNEEKLEEMKIEIERLEDEILKDRKDRKEEIEIISQKLKNDIELKILNEISKEKRERDKIIGEMKNAKKQDQEKFEMKDEEIRNKINQIQENNQKREVMEEQVKKNIEVVKKKIEKEISRETEERNKIINEMKKEHEQELEINQKKEMELEKRVEDLGNEINQIRENYQKREELKKPSMINSQISNEPRRHPNRNENIRQQNDDELSIEGDSSDSDFNDLYLPSDSHISQSCLDLRMTERAFFMGEDSSDDI